MKIPPDATVVRNSKLTLIKILSQLTAKDGRLDTLKNEVKTAMAEKKARFAQSDLVDARLQATSFGAKKFVDPKRLWALVAKKRITIEQFLSVLCVRTSLMPEILSGIEIDAISKAADGADAQASDALYTAWKEGVTVDLDRIEAAILATVD